MLNEDGQIASDTMTSVQASLNAAMRKFETEKDMTKIYENRDKIYCTETGAIALFANKGETQFCKKLKGEYPNLKNFISMYHTIGNYCPVPAGFNAARSAGGSYDYWDLTLMKICQWYLSYDLKWDDNRRDALIQDDLLHGRGCALNCKRWLELFGKGEIGWRNFVDTLFMQDHVYTKEDDVWVTSENYYRPKPLWKDHGWESIKLPPDKCDDFFKEVSARIEKRGKRIVKALRERVDIE